MFTYVGSTWVISPWLENSPSTFSTTPECHRVTMANVKLTMVPKGFNRHRRSMREVAPSL